MAIPRCLYYSRHQPQKPVVSSQCPPNHLQVSASWGVAATGHVLHPKDTLLEKMLFCFPLYLAEFLDQKKKPMPLSTEGCLLTQGVTPVFLTEHYSNPAPKFNIFFLLFIFSPVLMFLIKTKYHVPLSNLFLPSRVKEWC